MYWFKGMFVLSHHSTTARAYYRIAGNFRGVQFLRMVDLYYFMGLNFVDTSTHTHYVLYN